MRQKMTASIAAWIAASIAAALLFWSCAAAAAPAITSAAADAALIKRGEYLAIAGDCIACHSNGHDQPFAGGLPTKIPMLGTIYSTNITPDVQTGIGRWTLPDFDRAVRQGISKDGHHLYPAMPYPSYAKINDDDIKALYAYFEHGVAPVRRAQQAETIPLEPRRLSDARTGPLRQLPYAARSGDAGTGVR